jgi:predicted negative regulator of RcsB-dependent stress response
VDENLTDSERVEQLKLWWRENGWFLIGGVALGALALFGWNQYTAYRDHRSEEAAALYQSVKDAKDPVQANTVLQRMRADFPSNAYTGQAGLLVAGMLVVSAPEHATDELTYVLEHTKDPELAMIARLRLARVLAYREKYDDALKTLKVDKPGKFAGRINDVRGDVEYARGNVEEARKAWLEAMVADGSELLDRNLLQMKLNDLPGGTAAPPAAATSEPPAAAAPAASGQPSAVPPAAANGEGA